MHTGKTMHRIASFTLAAAMMASAATAVAQPGHGMPPPGQDHRDDNHGQGGPRGQQGRPDFHFDQNNRNQFAQHYGNDARRWQNNKRRPNFTPGYVIPRTYAVRPVPRSYWNGMAAPPPGYQYGYYDGYVVAYNPTTRIVADVLDIVAGLSNR
jgi:Ni/Co efflux regulator RcnB